MTVAHPRRDNEATAPRLDALLVDAITEVVALAPDRMSRAVAIGALVREIYDSVEWVHAADAGDEELVSFARVLAETQHHSDRMRAVGVTTPMTTAPALGQWAVSDVEVSSYDDLSAAADSAGGVILECRN